MGMRHNLSAYDAAYVALALELGGELPKADHTLAKAARRHIRVT